MKPPYQTASAVKINKVVKLALALYCCSTPKWGTTRKGKGNPHTEISSPAKPRKKYKKTKVKGNEKKDEENSEITTIVTALAVFPSSKRRQQETKRDKQMTELKQEERRERERDQLFSVPHDIPHFSIFPSFSLLLSDLTRGRHIIPVPPPPPAPALLISFTLLAFVLNLSLSKYQKRLHLWSRGVGKEMSRVYQCYSVHHRSRSRNLAKLLPWLKIWRDGWLPVDILIHVDHI